MKFFENNNDTKIFALGGLGEVGKNMYCVMHNNEIVITDAGMLIPEGDLMGVDYVIPDFTFLKKNESKIKGLFITHGHEDHIGALPYILKKLDVPVYGTMLSIGLIQVKLKEHKLSTAQLNVITPKQIVKLSNMSVEFIKNNHYEELDK